MLNFKSLITVFLLCMALPAMSATDWSQLPLDRVTEGAGENIPEAWYDWGMRYYNGTGGVKKNYYKSFKRIRAAAEEGYDKAQYQLGLMYFAGRGIKRDEQAALKWFDLSARQGNASAQTAYDILAIKMQDQRKAPPRQAASTPTPAEQKAVSTDNNVIADVLEQGDKAIQKVLDLFPGSDDETPVEQPVAADPVPFEEIKIVIEEPVETPVSDDSEGLGLFDWVPDLTDGDAQVSDQEPVVTPFDEVGVVVQEQPVDTSDYDTYVEDEDKSVLDTVLDWIPDFGGESEAQTPPPEPTVTPFEEIGVVVQEEQPVDTSDYDTYVEDSEGKSVLDTVLDWIPDLDSEPQAKEPEPEPTPFSEVIVVEETVVDQTVSADKSEEGWFSFDEEGSQNTTETAEQEGGIGDAFSKTWQGVKDFFSPAESDETQ